MTTHVEKLGSFEDFKAPWGDGEIDADKAAKLIYDTRLDKAKALDARDAVTAERDDYKAKVTEYETKDLSEVDRLKRENEELRNKPAAGQESAERKALRLEVALEKGLTGTQAKRLVGETREDLEADADEIKESWGGGGSDAGADDDGDGSVRRAPKKARNASTPPVDEGADDDDMDKAAAAYTGAGGLRL